MTIKIHSMAGLAMITKDPVKSTTLYQELLELPLNQRDEYLSTGQIAGCNHFGICPLSIAAQFCFGTTVWPAEIPQPNATLEFELDSPQAVIDAVEQLKNSGQEIIHEAKLEPWGQTVARFMSPENVLIGLTYTPALHTQQEP